MPFENLKRSNIDLRLKLRIYSVKMRWWMIWGEYSNNQRRCPVEALRRPVDDQLATL